MKRVSSVIFIGLICLGIFSCGSDSESVGKKEGRKISEKTDLRKAMNGYWVLISQSFTRGHKLEKFPVGGTVGLIFNENDEWFSVSRKFHLPEDTITKGKFYLEGDHLVMEVTESKDLISYEKLDGKIQLHGRFIQIEGEMSYANKEQNDYMHAILGRSARSLEEVFEASNK
ncbi:MAG: hypothetical protein KDC84_08975 [Crocinitomicaceae bacterium]|nr:hypothetical protein [Crocinitomicaceae bacterium]